MRTKYVSLLFFLVVLIRPSMCQSIENLLNTAYNNNPELKALKLEYEASLKKAPQVGQLTDPTVGLGVPVLRPETRLGSQILSISANQMFPWPGTLKLKEDVVIAMAKSKYERIAAARLNIDYQIKTAYYNLYFLKANQNVIRKSIRIFETIEKVALSKVENGNAIASDVLQIRIKIEDLKIQTKLLEEQKRVHTALINEALNKPTTTEIQVDTARISLSELVYDLEFHKKNIQSNHPLIKQIDWSIESSFKELELNDMSNKPAFGLGLDYSLVNDRSDAIPADNGRDILVPKLMVSLPIFRKKYTAKKQEEELMQQAYDLRKEQLTNELLRAIQQYKSDHESAKLLYHLSKKQIEISNSAYDILLADYSSKGNRFDELMKLQSDINKYEIELLKAIIQSHTAKFKIERLTDF